MRNVVKKEDFEVYEIHVPFSKLGKTMVSYLNHELEKMHPGFDELCCFDYRLAFERRGFVAKVFVMNRMVLESYRRNRRNFVCLEGQGSVVFFAKIRREKIFGLFVLVLVTMALCLMTRSCLNGMGRRNDVSAMNVNVVEEVSVDFGTGVDMQLVLVDLVLEIEKRDGKIQGVRIDENGFSVNVSGVFPELVKACVGDFTGVSVSCANVNYVKNEPRFWVDARRNDFASTSSVMDEEMFWRFRDCVLESGAEIQQENVSEMKLVLYLTKDAFEECLLKIDAGMTECGLDCCGLNLSLVSDGANLEMNLGVSNLNRNLMRHVAEHKGVFFETEEQNEIWEHENEITEFVYVETQEGVGQEMEFCEDVEEDVSLESVRLPGEYFGSMTGADGVKIVFYKNSEGKICGVKE